MTPVDASTADERQRLKHYSVFAALALPTMGGFGVFNLITGHVGVGVAVITSVVGLFVGWLLMRAGVRQELVFRSNSVFFAGVILFLTYSGGPEGSQILWSYSFPLVVHFLMSQREGLVWSIIHYVLTAAIVLDLIPVLSPYAYSVPFQIRYLVTLFIVAAVSYWFEYFRVEYRLGMEAERAQLQDALAQVRTLRGLLPICSSCKKIRDDSDQWVDVEDYIHDRSEADFSHGICPQCAGKLYPEFNGDSPTDPSSSSP